MAPAIPFIVLGITAASAGFSAVKGIQAAKRQKKAARAQRRAAEAAQQAEKIKQVRADLAARKEKQKQIRETRIRRAQIIQSSVNSGVGAGTSTVEGAFGGLGSSLSGNIGDVNQQQGFSQSITQQNLASAQFQTQAATQQGKAQADLAQGQLAQDIGGSVTSIFDRFGGSTSAAGGNLFSGAK